MADDSASRHIIHEEVTAFMRQTQTCGVRLKLGNIRGYTSGLRRLARFWQTSVVSAPQAEDLQNLQACITRRLVNDTTMCAPFAANKLLNGHPS